MKTVTLKLTPTSDSEKADLTGWELSSVRRFTDFSTELLTKVALEAAGEAIQIAMTEYMSVNFKADHDVEEDETPDDDLIIELQTGMCAYGIHPVFSFSLHELLDKLIQSNGVDGKIQIGEWNRSILKIGPALRHMSQKIEEAILLHTPQAAPMPPAARP